MKFSHQAMQHMVLAAPETPFALSLAKRASDLLAKQTKYLLLHNIPSSYLDSKEFKSQAKELRNAPWHRSKGSEEEPSCEFHDPDCGILSVKVAPEEYDDDDDDFGDEESCFVVPYQCERCEIHDSGYVDAIEDVAYDPAHDYSYHSHQVYGGWDEVPAYIEDSQAYWEGEYNVAASSSDGRVLTPEYVCSEGTFTVPSDWDAETFKFTLRECLDDDTRCPQNGKKIGCWDVANVQDMEELFREKAVPSGVRRWDVSNVKNMRFMFREGSFEDPTSISGWNVSQVQKTEDMFSYVDLTGVDLGLWGRKLTSAYNMFKNARGKPIGLSKWDTSRITDMYSMFMYSKFSPSTLKDISDWDISRVTSVKFIFYYQNLTGVDLGSWGKQLTNAESMFYEATGDPIGLSDWDTSRLTTMRNMFYRFSGKIPDISDWDVARVTDMQWMFYKSTAPKDLWKWNFERVENMAGMFHESLEDSLKNLDLSTWNLKEDVDMTDMFKGTFYASDDLPKSEVIEKFNEDQIRRFGVYFNYGRTDKIDIFCPSENKVEAEDWSWMVDNLGKGRGKPGCWDISKVFKLDGLFYAQPVPPGIWGWDVSHVTSMVKMFRENVFDAPLGIKNWKFEALENATQMFYGAIFGDKFVSVDIHNMKRNDDESQIELYKMFETAKRGEDENVFVTDGSVRPGSVPEWMSDREAKQISPYFIFRRKEYRRNEYEDFCSVRPQD